MLTPFATSDTMMTVPFMSCTLQPMLASSLVEMLMLALTTSSRDPSG